LANFPLANYFAPTAAYALVE